MLGTYTDCLLYVLSVPPTADIFAYLCYFLFLYYPIHIFLSPLWPLASYIMCIVPYLPLVHTLEFFVFNILIAACSLHRIHFATFFTSYLSLSFHAIFILSLSWISITPCFSPIFYSLHLAYLHLTPFKISLYFIVAVAVLCY